MSLDTLNAETTSDSLEQAVEKALMQLNCSRAEAEIEVLQTHSRGFLGLFGKRPAKIRARLCDRGAIARQVMRRLLELSGLDAAIDLSRSSRQIELKMTSENNQLLIGRHGQTLDALQLLVTTITDRLTTDRTPLEFDIAGYRLKRKEFLHRLAQRMSRKVRQSGKPASTPPLNLFERRILHELFKLEPGLESHSKSYQKDRKVIVLKKRG
jgi:spoIIIJ-associated protein